MDVMAAGRGQPRGADAPGGRAGVGGLRAWYRRHVWTATGLLLLLVVAAGFVAIQVATWGRVGDGVTVAGVDLHGLTTAAAARVVARDVTPRVSTVTLKLDDRHRVMLTLAQLGMSVDETATAEAAVAAGRRRLPLGLTAWLPGRAVRVAPVVRVDAARYKQGLAVVEHAAGVAPRDAGLRLAQGRVVVVPATEGRTVDAVALERSIVAAVAAGRSYAGPVPTEVADPEVGTLDAQARAAAAAKYLAAPVTLRYRERQVVLGPEELAKLLSVNTGADAEEYPLTFRNDRARAALHRLFAFAERPPVDATVDVHPDGTITVGESRSGEVLDMDVLLEDLDDAASGGGLRTIFVALRPALPRLSTADVESQGFSALGSQFVTYFDPRNKARAGNIALAAKLVDGTVIAPGETFSLNAAIGPRTTNRGFDYAPVIASDNVLRQGVGGGICQYATTLFNAAFFAGLPIVERHPHSFYISHYPTGRDATVAWGSADLRFRNDTPHSLLVRSWVAGGTLTVALVGRTGRTVTYTTSPFTDVRKPAHGQSNPRVIYDADLGPGVVRWERGVDGHAVRVERTVRSADGAVLFRDTFVSQYDPLDWVKRVGT